MALALKVTVPSIALTYDKKALKATLRVAGSDVAATARGLIRSSDGGGRVYYGSGGSSKYRGGYKAGKFSASFAGMAPRNVTGTLARSIRVLPFKSGEGVAIRDKIFYSLFLQGGARGGGGNRHGGNLLLAGGTYGGGRTRLHNRLKKSAISKTRVLEARPFMTRALTMRETGLKARIGQAALSGIKMQRVSASGKARP